MEEINGTLLWDAPNLKKCTFCYPTNRLIIWSCWEALIKGFQRRTRWFVSFIALINTSRCVHNTWISNVQLMYWYRRGFEQRLYTVGVKEWQSGVILFRKEKKKKKRKIIYCLSLKKCAGSVRPVKIYLTASPTFDFL